jgi:hypothetical protein
VKFIGFDLPSIFWAEKLVSTRARQACGELRDLRTPVVSSQARKAISSSERGVENLDCGICGR